MSPVIGYSRTPVTNDERPMTNIHRIAHISDIHFGKITQPEIVDVLVEEINAFAPSLVAVSGDLTQRARHHEFRAARAMLDRFAAPVLVVPGNHDVYPWWNPVRRVFQPLRRYRRMITPDLTPTFEADGLAVLGLNTAHGRTGKGGRVGKTMRGVIRPFFGSKPEGTFKVLVVHHQLSRIGALKSHDVAHRARRTLEKARAVGVDLVLCGHLHVSHVERLEVVGAAPDEKALVVASAGTATSSRGRATNRGTNFYNQIRIAPDAFEIEERQFRPAAGVFERSRLTRFGR